MHLLRDLLVHVPRHAASMVAAFVRTVFTQPDEPSARTQLRAVAERRATSFPKAADALLAAEDDVLAYLACPREHWTKIWSTNPLEQLRPRARPAQRRGRHLPQPRRPAAARHGPAGRAARRVADEGKRYLPQNSDDPPPSGVPGTTLSDLLKAGMAVCAAIPGRIE